jgi:hypothetical protein
MKISCVCGLNMCNKLTLRLEECILPLSNALVLRDSLHVEELLGRVCANLDFGSTSKSYRKEWMTLLASDSSIDLVSTVFWLTISESFNKGDREFNEGALDRASDCYRHLYAIVPTHQRRRFSRVLPIFLSQFTSFALFSCFPKSRTLFNKSFQVRLLARNYKLFSGWIPHDISVDDWRMDLGLGDMLLSARECKQSSDQVVVNSVTGPSALMARYNQLHGNHALASMARCRAFSTFPVIAPSPSSSPVFKSPRQRDTNLFTWPGIRKEIEIEKYRLGKRLASLSPRTLGDFAEHCYASQIGRDC